MPKNELQNLPNVGPVLAANLRAVGICTVEDLKQTDYKDLFLRIRCQVDSGACLALLMGLVGAQKGVPKTMLNTATKAEIKAFYKSLP